MPALIGWLFFSAFAAFLLGMACEPLGIPKRFRPPVVAIITMIACVLLEMAWLLLPLIALVSALIARLLSTITFEHSVRVGNRVRVVDYSHVKGNLGERLRGEVAALRKAIATEAPAETAEARTAIPGRGVIGVSARW